MSTLNDLRRTSVRAGFVGYWLLLLVVPLDIAWVLILVQQDAAICVSMALLAAPASYFVARCITAPKTDLSTLISLQTARVIYASCLVGSLMFLLLCGLAYALPGLLAALCFSWGEPGVRRLLRGLIF
ncbi:hypothetical protein [Pseudomonas sp. LRF_L74]|uniref:hypothetical protein n=1 Tax=Pseudomonas sp. LRF_L74 TaxID=3369422 RepID=UPI003F5F56D8